MISLPIPPVDGVFSGFGRCLLRILPDCAILLGRNHAARAALDKELQRKMKLGIGVHTLDSISPYLSINAAKA